MEEEYFDKLTQGVCPVCGEKLQDISGCQSCAECGFAVCD